MASDDLDKAASRMIAAVRRVRHGLELTRHRIAEREAKMTRLDVDGGTLIVHLTDPGNDIDFYTFDLGRLQDVAREVMRVFADPVSGKQPVELVEAVKRFDIGVPNLKAFRNALAHPSDDARLDSIVFFSSAKYLDFLTGIAVDLVNPLGAHHDYAMNLCGTLVTFLQNHITAAIKAGDVHTIVPTSP